MKWTKDIPKADGYYWFMMSLGDIPMCIYFNSNGEEASTCISPLDILRVKEEDDCRFSSVSISPPELLEW